VLCPPAIAFVFLPVVLGELISLWPAFAPRSVIGAQIEQETCPSLDSPKCWNPRAELRTSREYGFGLGQVTVTDRFNTWAETRARYSRELAGWSWEGRFDARYQIRALVLMDRDLAARCAPLMRSGREAIACMASSYNGGFAGFTRDRSLCGDTAGCDRTRWFGHVERVSYKARMAAPGYSRSFFDVNRDYVRNVVDVRRGRYVGALDVGRASCP
jgi:hypothetical protein